jgi:hypothetical protein
VQWQGNDVQWQGSNVQWQGSNNRVGRCDGKAVTCNGRVATCNCRTTIIGQQGGRVRKTQEQQGTRAVRCESSKAMKAKNKDNNAK